MPFLRGRWCTTVEAHGWTGRRLQTVAVWCENNDLALNVGKCPVVTCRRRPIVANIQGTPVPQIDEYPYLGFPFTTNGIDFERHPLQRTGRAQAKVALLSCNSREWGLLVRLGVYNRTLATEYDEALAWARTRSQPGGKQDSPEAIRE